MCAVMVLSKQVARQMFTSTLSRLVVDYVMEHLSFRWSWHRPLASPVNQGFLYENSVFASGKYTSGILNELE